MLVSKRTLLFQGPVFRFSIEVDGRKHNLAHVYRYMIIGCACCLCTMGITYHVYVCVSYRLYI